MRIRGKQCRSTRGSRSRRLTAAPTPSPARTTTSSSRSPSPPQQPQQQQQHRVRRPTARSRGWAAIFPSTACPATSSTCLHQSAGWETSCRRSWLMAVILSSDRAVIHHERGEEKHFFLSEVFCLPPCLLVTWLQEQWQRVLSAPYRGKNSIVSIQTQHQ